MKGQEIITCKQCGSNKVKKSDAAPIFLVGGIAISWIPLFGWILGPLFIIFGIVGLLKKDKKFLCQECKHVNKVDKETFVQYKNHLKASK